MIEDTKPQDDPAAQEELKGVPEHMLETGDGGDAAGTLEEALAQLRADLDTA